MPDPKLVTTSSIYLIMLGGEAGLRQRSGALGLILNGRVIIGFVSRFCISKCHAF